eukprot:Skav220257  [mRNA]  locus=scaffold1696:364188:367707:+ [translate_table: standard]
MIVIGLYMALLLDLATLSAKLSAYVLVAIGVISELTLMMIALSPILSVAVGIFLVVVSVGCLSIFVSQLTASYREIYDSMVGYASLRRMQIEVDYLQTTRRKTWNRFVKSLMFDEPLEFGEGDIGLPGGIQIMEAANLYPQYRESIQRYGGTRQCDRQRHNCIGS